MEAKVLLALVVIALMLIPASCTQPLKQEPPQDRTVANKTGFLAKCEHCNITFEKAYFGDFVSYNYLGSVYL
jgi:hypothetical protein